MKKIIFLSALDFKEKSIQVIRKTPEAYANAGWDVDYVVARDNLESGNYSYEREINPPGVNVVRFYWPLPRLRNMFGRFSRLIFSKISSIWVVVRLAFFAYKLVKKKEHDIVYGYELHGVLAMNLLKLLLPDGIRYVSRFQGTFLNEMLERRQYLRIIFNLDLVCAIYLNSSLLIMTDDGTQGDEAVKKIKGSKEYRMVFWPNGVDHFPALDREKGEKTWVFVSVSRLVEWKRVDRCLRALHELRNIGFDDFVYFLVGDGGERSYLETLTSDLGLEDNVRFVGAVSHSDAINHMLRSDFFLSMYDSSNVGNPLLEAVRLNKLIVTLNNGDTYKWISHKLNGLIYSPHSINYLEIARDIYGLIQDSDARACLKKNLQNTETEKLWTWEERLNAEVDLLNKL